MERVPLKSGGWVMLREQSEITQRGRRGIQAIAAGLGDAIDKIKDAAEDASMDALGFTEEQLDAVFRMQEATVVAFVADWSRDEPVPTIATIGDLPADLFDELSIATAKRGATVALSLDTSPGDGTPDPKDLSGSSESSDGSLRDDSELAPILT